MTAKFTDLLLEQDSEGVFDLVIDEDARDFTTTAGLEMAELASLFTDARAPADEVADPLKRRGWIGDLVSDFSGDTFGSLIWLYEQRRLTPDVTAGLRLAAESALAWQVPDIAKSVSAEITRDSAARSVRLIVNTTFASGDRSSRSWALVDATLNGLLARL